MKKYELRRCLGLWKRSVQNFIKIKINNKTRYQIRACKDFDQIRALKDFSSVKKGDSGEYIESKDNLSHDGNCGVSGNVLVYGNAQISGNAWVYENAQILWKCPGPWRCSGL